MSLLGKIEPVSIMRAVVVRAATDSREVYYSYDRPRWWQIARWLKLWAHLRFMREEDRKAGL